MAKYALALEGGGAKGAYQVGAIKALLEKGYEFNCVVGTSVGAINAAFIAQGDFDKTLELWKNISFKDLLDIDNKKAGDLFKGRFSKELLKDIERKLKLFIKSRGIDTSLMRELLEKYIDEDKIRNSSIRFGLVTFCVTDFKPEELFIEDIPKGKLIDYLLASTNLPVFQRAKIEEKDFLDGGSWDNCPVKMLEQEGYKDILALRLYRINRIRHYGSINRNKEIKLKMFVPKYTLPSILNFESNNLREMLKMGYIDTIKALNKLDGNEYTFNYITKEQINKYKDDITPEEALKILRSTMISYKPGDNVVELAIKKAIPLVSTITVAIPTSDFKKQLINIVEYVAKKEKIDKYEIYDFDEFVKIIKKKVRYKSVSMLDKAIYQVIKSI